MIDGWYRRLNAIATATADITAVNAATATDITTAAFALVVNTAIANLHVY